ncbi:hypothetical protein ACFW9D_24940 [Streptomyces sp. NPDC059524]|uniref:hypothetical protein n=1 Tax=Streptomyces sp. NPDC059524 TaxID=3346856 RepID=UPI00367CD68C
MAHHLPDGIPPHLLMWQRVRRYAVPPSMIETATARRGAGDWAGACAAARVDPDLDLRAVRRRHGTEQTARLRADLRRLAPDLLRWHLPRMAPDGRLRPGLTVPLVRYGAPGDPPLHLVARTMPVGADAGQRISLALWEGSGGAPLGDHPHPHPDRRFRLDLHRHLWDAERSAELAARAPADLATEAELLLRGATGRPRGVFTVRLDARRRAVLELVAPDDSHVPTVRPLRDAVPARQAAALPALPEAAVHEAPDLSLLRAGLVTLDALHPLVAAALHPYAPPEPALPHDADAAPADPHRVECRGEIHRIALRDGVLTAVDHDAEQLRREDLLVALGGPPLPCLRAIDAVHRTPEALPAVRERLGHGDVRGALDVVEGLLGPGAMLRAGPLRDALEQAAAGRVDHGLFRSGLPDDHPGAAAGPGGRLRLARSLPPELLLKRGRRNGWRRAPSR